METAEKDPAPEIYASCQVRTKQCLAGGHSRGTAKTRTCWSIQTRLAFITLSGFGKTLRAFRFNKAEMGCSWSA